MDPSTQIRKYSRPEISSMRHWVRIDSLQQTRVPTAIFIKKKIKKNNI